MTEMISADISYIKEIQNSMLQDKDAWLKLVWFLLHHEDVDLQSTYQLYLNNDPKYNEWLKEHDIKKIDSNKSAEEILLAYINDYIEVLNTNDNVSVQEFFKEKDRKVQKEFERKQAELMTKFSFERNRLQTIRRTNGTD